MLTAAQLIDRANQIAKVPGFTAQGIDILNTILGDLCEDCDFALARGLYQFNMNPSLSTNFGSGPYPLPLDYLRTSQSSGSEGVQYALFYMYNGVPYPLIPIDLGQWDMQVQQAGLQNFPFLFATDISPESSFNDRIALTATVATHGTTAIDTFVLPTQPTGYPTLSTNVLTVGMGVAGIGIAPGTTIAALTGTPPTGATLSQAAQGSFAAASVFFGTPPNAYIWPGPSSAFATTLRYQLKKPPITDPSRVPWFPNEGFLITELAGRMMQFAGDDRSDGFLRQAQIRLGKYIQKSDDKTNRSQQVTLDRRRFGTRYSRLPNTKTIGY